MSFETFESKTPNLDLPFDDVEENEPNLWLLQFTPQFNGSVDEKTGHNESKTEYNEIMKANYIVNLIKTVVFQGSILFGVEKNRPKGNEYVTKYVNCIFKCIPIIDEHTADGKYITDLQLKTLIRSYINNGPGSERFEKDFITLITIILKSLSLWDKIH